MSAAKPINQRKRKICAFSGKRGGFGAYLPLMQLINSDPELELQILLGDMHSSVKFGETVNEAKKFFPAATIELIEMGAGRGDSVEIRSENLGVCLQKTTGILSKLKPDVVLVHGDRGEHLIVAFAALNLGIPVAHTQGGEVSGNIDDTQRHAITKLAHLHFPENQTAADRIRGLGEEDWRIKVVGSTYIDRIAKKMYTPEPEARKKYSLAEKEGFYLSIFHPDTFETREANYVAAKAMLSSLKNTGLRTILTYPCSDPGYEGVIKAIDEIKNDPQFVIHKNIDNLDFLGLMAGAKAIVGNSSSALVEAPYFQLPAINIGKRQLGRDREDNVVDATPTGPAITEALKFISENDDYLKKLAACGTRLGNGQAAEKIIAVLKETELGEKILRKKLVQ